MNVRLLILIAFLSLIGTRVLSQNISPEDKQKYIGYMDSSYIPLVQEALWEIEGKKVVEAIPALERNIWRLTPYEQYWCVRAMWRLGSANTLTFAKVLIDTIIARGDEGTGTLSDPLTLKVETTEILLDLGDHSTVGYVFELLRRDSTASHSKVVAVLRLIILGVPEYADSARTQLVGLAFHHSRDRVRWLALTDLIEVYGSQVNDVLRQAAVNDPNSDNRIFALRKLMTLEYPQIRELLYQRLYDEMATYRDLIADSLLTRYGTPQDYQSVKEYQSWEPDSMNSRWINYSLSNFKPPPPPATMSPLVMLDSLISYKHQCHALGWILNEGILTSLDQKLDAARKAIVNDRPSAKQILQAFVNEVEALNNQGNQITREAYVFLRYHALYIIERL